jgi:hypothetical protein
MSESPTLHLNPDEIELWALGLLPAARALHLAQCPACLTTADKERKLFRELVQLERFAPGPDFVEKVMAQVRIKTAVEDGGGRS